MEFYSVDTLTGKIVGRLYPVKWELSDPLREPGTGSLTLAPEVDQRSVAVEATRPRKRWVACRDEVTGVWVWGGPVPRKPTPQTDGTLTVPLVDWRSWFHTAQLRPGDTTTGNYVVKDRDQGTIARNLLTRALDDSAITDTTLSLPPIIIDTSPTTGVLRDRTLVRLSQSIGASLDGLVTVDRGIDWWTYVTPSRDDPTVLAIHVAVAYPERTLRTDPVRIEWQVGKGGNVAETPSWPEASEEVTRMWVLGDGEPPDQVVAYDETTEPDVLWESTYSASGVKKAKRAWEHAYGQRLQAQQYAASAEFVLSPERLPFGDVAPGDRARVVYDDGWEAVDVDAARIVGRVMSGGRGEPTRHRLVVDLSDVVPRTTGTPGEAGESEEV